MQLLPQDVVIAAKLALHPEARWTIAQLTSELGLSASQVHRGIKRCIAARLLSAEGRNAAHLRALTLGVEELAIHGVKYAFPLERRGTARGLPTSWGAPPLSGRLTGGENPPVWPDAHGTVRGEAWVPLHPCVVRAARQDARLYQFLVLVDAFRGGGAREREVAQSELKRLLWGKDESDGTAGAGGGSARRNQ